MTRRPWPRGEGGLPAIGLLASGLWLAWLPATAVAGDAFLAALGPLCGKAYEGRIVANEPADPADPFSGQRLVMHVRECGERVVRIPFHVGEDRSRTWVLMQLADGLALAHDHRHADGSPDVLTLYGGTGASSTQPQRREFPADAWSQALFREQGRAVSIANVWALELEPGRRFVYELARPGRLFRVEFDLTRPVAEPPPPWGTAP